MMTTMTTTLYDRPAAAAAAARASVHQIGELHRDANGQQLSTYQLG